MSATISRASTSACAPLSGRNAAAAGCSQLVVASSRRDGVAGAQCAWLMLATGSANLVIYWVVKRSTRRCRPFEQCDDIRACMVAPDRFSFPSGHVLHATAFALLLSAFHPALAWPLGLFAAVLALARVVLGLHYPSDVLAGAVLGLCTAGAALLAR